MQGTTSMPTPADPCRELNASIRRQARVIADAEGISFEQAKRRAWNNFRRRLDIADQRQQQAHQCGAFWKEPVPDTPLVQTGNGEYAKAIHPNDRRALQSAARLVVAVIVLSVAAVVMVALGF